MTRLSAMGDLAALLDRLDAAGRFALLKLATGAMRIGISSRLAKAAFAQAFSVSIDDVEEYWHGQTPRSEEHTSELQSLMRISYAVFCLKKKQNQTLNQLPT